MDHADKVQPPKKKFNFFSLNFSRMNVLNIVEVNCQI